MNKDSDRNPQAMPESVDFDLLAEDADPEIAAAIRAALTEIEPEPGAETRMYQNILKKAAAQSVQLPDAAAHAAPADPAASQTSDFSAANQTSAATELQGAPTADCAQEPQTAPVSGSTEAQQTAPAAVTPIRSAARRKWRRYLSLAACLVLIVTAGLTLPQVLPNGADHVPGGSSDIQNPEGNDPPTLAGSPFIEVDGPEDFADLQLSIAAPKGASEVSYCIAYETTARVDFTLDGHAYTYLAARTDTDISGIDGAVQEILNLTLPNADGKETGVILEWLCIVEDDTPSGADTGAAGDSDPAASADADAPGIWRASWQTADVTYCVLNEDGAAEDAVCALVQTLAAQTA